MGWGQQLEDQLWLLGMVLYVGAAVATGLPILVAVFRKVPLHPGGTTFEDSPNFSEEAKLRLKQPYSRMTGTLLFWKKQAEIFRRLHYYTICWTIPSSLVIPFLVQASRGGVYSKWLITIISAFTGILLAFHRALKVDANFKAFRYGESEFYDTYRRMLDRPESFGTTEAIQLATYFDSVENIRKYIRNAEIDNLPTIEQVRSQLESENSSSGSKAK
jgi:hypothetical protein